MPPNAPRARGRRRTLAICVHLIVRPHQILEKFGTSQHYITRLMRPKMWPPGRSTQPTM
jgi:hypothetical protein